MSTITIISILYVLYCILVIVLTEYDIIDIDKTMTTFGRGVFLNVIYLPIIPVILIILFFHWNFVGVESNYPKPKNK